MILQAVHRPVVPTRSPRARGAAAVAALLIAAVVLGGTAGLLLGFVALIAALDAVLPMPGRGWSVADDRFVRLVRERAREGRRRRLRGGAPDRLEVLDDRVGWAASAARRSAGVEQIPLDSIAGTVEELQARAFDRRFRPERAARRRWTSIWIAHANGAPLDPIAVYRVDGRHFVRDGHHRVSVALDRGATTIDAEIVELRRPRQRRR